MNHYVEGIFFASSSSVVLCINWHSTWDSSFCPIGLRYSEKMFWLSLELNAINYAAFTNLCCGNVLNYMGMRGNITFNL